MSAYEILGITRDASADEIRLAYRRLARRLHPDVGGSDTIEMARLNAARRTLRDPVRRAAYDAGYIRPGPDAPAGNAHFEPPGGHMQPRPGLRVMVFAASALLFVVLVAIILVGFGRVGVSTQP